MFRLAVWTEWTSFKTGKESGISVSSSGLVGVPPSSTMN